MPDKPNKIDRLIEKLCPDGVEYKELGEMFNFKNGYTPSKSKKDYWQDGTIPWFRMEDIRLNGSILSKATQQVNVSAIKGGKVFPANSILVATSATIGEHALITVPHLSNQRFVSLSLNIKYQDLFNIKFLYYYFYILDDWCIKNVTKSSFASVDMSGFRKFPIPLPPLPVQEEIVKILDTFTELEAELEAELESRKKQYEYYRDELLTFGDEVEWKTLGEVSNYRRGSFPQPYGNKEWYDGKDSMPFVQVVDVDKNMKLVPSTKNRISKLAQPKSVFAQSGSVLVTLQGSIGRVAITQYDAYVDRTLAIFESYKTDINIKYFAYQLQKIFGTEKEKARGSTIKTITKEEFTKFKIPIPSLSEQERIVGILDKFDALVNDISAGLPAEITRRRKQYEYYRSKLLTFKKLAG
ncbi:MAG TPA: restriction endonuclease subunit S [Treponemataceae bacterium]|nr:restriction endonuclease subunit S [Treponemataceae bacterium]HOS36310.1 restriction endonuclease subunit S [Treponemataceae bacterium]HOU39458.1 restriction endonuclease subunit S [Treponemataceae bacterium]